MPDGSGPGDAAERDAASRGVGASALAGGAWIGLGALLPHAYIVVISIAAAHYLGAANLGRQNFIAFAQTSLIFLLTGGVATALSRYVGHSVGEQRVERVRTFVALALRIEVAAAIAGGALLGVVAAAGARPQAAWALAAAACALGTVAVTCASALAALRRWREATAVGLATGAVATVLIVAVLDAGGGITSMFAVDAAASAANLLGSAWLLRRALRGIPHNPQIAGLAGPFLRYAALGSLNVAITLVVWRRSELFFLDRFSPDSELAFYSIAFAALTALAGLNVTVATVVAPSVALLSGTGAQERIRAGFSRGVRLVILASLPLTALALALGPGLLTLAYPDEFAPARRILVVLLVPLPLIALMTLATAVLTGIGRLRVPVGVGAAAAVLNVALDLALIPRWDAIGAAAANATIQLVAAAAIFLLAARAVGGVHVPGLWLLRVAVTAATAGAAGWAVVASLPDEAGVPLGLIVSTGFLAVLATTIRVLPREDADWLVGRLGGRVGGVVAAACRRTAGAPIGEAASER